MSDYSFDIVAKIDQQELSNAIDLVRKEVTSRFDFKGAIAEVDLQKEHMDLNASDDMRMKQLIDVIQSKMAKRGISMKAFDFGEFESNVSGKVKCKVKIQNGLSSEQAKKVTKMIKDSKIKVTPKIQGDSVRVSGKSRDDLQAIIKMIREADLDFHPSFDNYK